MTGSRNKAKLGEAGVACGFDSEVSYNWPLWAVRITTRKSSQQLVSRSSLSFEMADFDPSPGVFFFVQLISARFSTPRDVGVSCLGGASLHAL